MLAGERLCHSFCCACLFIPVCFSSPFIGGSTSAQAPRGPTQKRTQGECLQFLFPSPRDAAKNMCFPLERARHLKCLILMFASAVKKPTMIRVTLFCAQVLSEWALWQWHALLNFRVCSFSSLRPVTLPKTCVFPLERARHLKCLILMFASAVKKPTMIRVTLFCAQVLSEWALWQWHALLNFHYSCCCFHCCC